MNLKQLETFVWIVRLGSFAAAADRLNTTQSAVSMRIRELEQDIGIGLFDRTHHKARLTAKGKELLGYAEQLITLASEMRHRIGDPKILAGVARVGVAEVIAVTWLPKLVAAVREKLPRVTLEIDMDLTNALITKLRDGDLDLGLIPGPVIEPNLVSQSVGQVPFMWMASPCLDISKKILTPHDLQDWPIISLSKDSHHYHTIAHWFSNHNAQYKWIISCNNMSVVADLTIAGVGVSHLPLPCYRETIKSRKLRVLKTQPLMPAVEFFVLSARGRFQPVANAISSLAQEVSDFVRP